MCEKTVSKKIFTCGDSKDQDVTFTPCNDQGKEGHTVNVIPSMMPYITSQFMPRVAGDRPEVVPAGSQNFGFLGQYAEVPQDCVFTVEYSVRSAMMAVYKLMKLDKEVDEVYPSQYDVRVLTTAAKTCLNLDKVPLQNIPLGKLLQGTELAGLLMS